MRTIRLEDAIKAEITFGATMVDGAGLAYAKKRATGWIIIRDRLELEERIRLDEMPMQVIRTDRQLDGLWRIGLVELMEHEL